MFFYKMVSQQFLEMMGIQEQNILRISEEKEMFVPCFAYKKNNFAARKTDK